MLKPTLMTSKKPILVTGSHRSGSTWVGRMIAEAPKMIYIHEPFSVSDPPGRGICNAEFKYWFTYITRKNEAGFYQPLKNMLELRYDLVGALKSVKSVKDVKHLKTEYGQFWKHCRQGSTPLIKDPIALFSSEWLAERFDTAVVVVIRHPAAFVSSIKKLNWPHPFSHFLEQPLLLQNVLHPFETELREYASSEHDLVDQAILLWRIIHYTISKYQNDHKDWIFIRHEDLSLDPLHGFQNLFGQLNIEFSEHVKEVIELYSYSANPSDTDAPVGSENSLKRDSKLNMSNWKSRLTPLEIKKIRNKVEDISTAFYTDQDW
jgi:hypothetical protein